MNAITYPTEQVLIEGCLIPQNEAWWCFYARFGDVIRRAVRRALGRCAADGNLVDELVQDALVRSLRRASP
jgi:DNA-directed RNA polymerase specialized sigma24 family protein